MVLALIIKYLGVEGTNRVQISKINEPQQVL